MKSLVSRFGALLVMGLLAGSAQGQSQSQSQGQGQGQNLEQQQSGVDPALPSNDLSAPTPEATPSAPEPKVDITDVKIGNGPEVANGDMISVHYTGYLLQQDKPNRHGKKFDSSYDRGKPISFVVGTHRVIPGWEAGLLGMKAGGRRTLIIPPELAYGAKGVPGLIPPNAALVFDVDLVSIKTP